MMHRSFVAATCALATFVLPVVAAAQAKTTVPEPAYAVDIPAGWFATLRHDVVQQYAIGRGDDQHVIRIMARAPQRDPQALAAELIADARARGEKVVDEGVTTACDGRPAHHWSSRVKAGNVTVDEHALTTAVTSGVALATYFHRHGVADRRDALDALHSLCPAPFAMPSIMGWTAASAPVGTVKLTSHDGASSFFGSYRRLAHELFPAIYLPEPGATVSATTTVTCANGELIRSEERKGGVISEVAEGYLHGYSYVFTYARLAEREPDPAAERALTSICRPTSTSASAPAASPSASTSP